MKENLNTGKLIHDRNGGDVHEQPQKETPAPPRVKTAPPRPAFTEVKEIISDSPDFSR